MDIQFIRNIDVNQFLRINEEALLVNESMNSLILGLSDSIQRGLRRSDDPLFITFMKNNSVVGQAVRTDCERPLAITEMEDKVISCLVENLFKEQIELAGVVGPNKTSSSFANEWVKKTGALNNLIMHQGVYELIKVKEPDYEEGVMIIATADSQSIAESYMLGFIKECFPEEKKPVDRSVELAARHIENATMYFWQNSFGEIVSTATKNRESRNAATVSLVYTPEEQRGKGYASRIVAQLSKKILQNGKEKCNLFTDLSNSTSNSIYQKIGYQFIGESLHYSFG